jgi:hypothetical protein
MEKLEGNEAEPMTNAEQVADAMGGFGHWTFDTRPLNFAVFRVLGEGRREQLLTRSPGAQGGLRAMITYGKTAGNRWFLGNTGRKEDPHRRGQCSLSRRRMHRAEAQAEMPVALSVMGLTSRGPTTLPSSS